MPPAAGCGTGSCRPRTAGWGASVLPPRAAGRGRATGWSAGRRTRGWRIRTGLSATTASRACPRFGCTGWRRASRRRRRTGSPTTGRPATVRARRWPAPSPASTGGGAIARRAGVAARSRHRDGVRGSAVRSGRAAGAGLARDAGPRAASPAGPGRSGARRGRVGRCRMGRARVRTRHAHGRAGSAASGGDGESVAEASRQAASGDPARQGGTAGSLPHVVQPRGENGTYWRATLRGDMRALPRRAVRSRDRDTTTPIMTVSRRPGGSTAWAAAASAAGASSPMSGWRSTPPAAPWACSRWTRTSAGPTKGTAPAGRRVPAGQWSWTRPAPKPGWFPSATGRAIFGSFWPTPGTDRRRSRCGPANPQDAASSRGTGKSGTCGGVSGRPRRWAGGSSRPRNAAAPTGGPGARSG